MSGTVAISILYLSTIFLPYINTAKFWFLSIIGLGFLVLFFLMLFLLIFWLFMRSKWWIVCLIVLLSGYRQVRAAIAFNLPSEFVVAKTSGTLRVMQWNVHSWNQVSFGSGPYFDRNAYPKMLDVIKKYDADILCIEEFLEWKDHKKKTSNIEDLKRMGYRYYYFLAPDKDGDRFEGAAIFSKFPFLESGEAPVAVRSDTDPLAYADVEINGQRIRVIVIHLQSVRFGSRQYNDLSNIKKAKRPDIHGSRTIFSKLKRGFEHRYVQALRVSRQVEESPYPVILSGDFNDVPNSGTYFRVSDKLQDAFLKKGFFIGRTFRFISPTLRIDYILPSKIFEVKQFERIKVPYSDHYPLVTDLKLK